MSSFPISTVRESISTGAQKGISIGIEKTERVVTDGVITIMKQESPLPANTGILTVATIAAAGTALSELAMGAFALLKDKIQGKKLRECAKAISDNQKEIDKAFKGCVEVLATEQIKYVKQLNQVLNSLNKERLIKQNPQAQKDFAKLMELTGDLYRHPNDIAAARAVTSFLEENADNIFIDNTASRDRLIEIGKIIAIIAVFVSIAAVLAFPPAGLGVLIAAGGMFAIAATTIIASTLFSISIKLAFNDLRHLIGDLISPGNKKLEIIESVRQPLIGLKELAEIKSKQHQTKGKPDTAPDTAIVDDLAKDKPDSQRPSTHRQ